MLFSKSHLQCFKPSSHLPQVTPSEKHCLTKARGHFKYSVKYFVHPKKHISPYRSTISDNTACKLCIKTELQTKLQ